MAMVSVSAEMDTSQEHGGMHRNEQSVQQDPKENGNGNEKRRYTAKRSGVGIARNEIPKHKSPMACRDLQNNSVTPPSGNNYRSVSLPNHMQLQQMSQISPMISPRVFPMSSPVLPRSNHDENMGPMLPQYLYTPGRDVLFKQPFPVGNCIPPYNMSCAQGDALSNHGLCYPIGAPDCNWIGTVAPDQRWNEMDKGSAKQTEIAITPPNSGKAPAVKTQMERSKMTNAIRTSGMQPTISSTSVTSVGSMLCTMVTTTAITTTLIQAGPATNKVSTSTYTNSTVLHLNDDNSSSENKVNLKENESKRKRNENPNEDSENKRRNQNEEEPINNDMMRRVLCELVDIKQCMAAIQSENAEWKSRMTTFETEIKDVKESVELAHNLVNDERKNRKQSEKNFKEEMVQRKKEIAGNTDLLKQYGIEKKGLQSDINK